MNRYDSIQAKSILPTFNGLKRHAEKVAVNHDKDIIERMAAIRQRPSESRNAAGGCKLS